MIKAKNLTKKFGRGNAEVIAVDRVDLEIAKGELVMIMGDSGCGKTTLISLLGCILTPDDGELILDGVPIGHEIAHLAEIRKRQIGFVFQLFNLIPYLTALENVLLAIDIAGNRGEFAEQKAIDLLKSVGLEKRLDHRPSQLSGGEKQRVSFARALANDPKIIFADEPTANLDSRQSENLMNLIGVLREKHETTIVVVTHYESLKKSADRVIQMRDGKIIS